jgi:hypothetical protein
MTWHGKMHFAAGTVGFIGLIASCFIFTYRFLAPRKIGWAFYSLITGVVFLTAFAGVASGSKGPAVIYFSGAVILSFLWLSAIFHHFQSTKPGY